MSEINKVSYMNKIRGLLTESQKRLINCIYKFKIDESQIDDVISQVEEALKKANEGYNQLRESNKFLNIDNSMLKDKNKLLEAEVEGLTEELKRALKSSHSRTSDYLLKPIAKRLELLDALETCGVTEWEGYEDAKNLDVTME